VTRGVPAEAPEARYGEQPRCDHEPHAVEVDRRRIEVQAVEPSLGAPQCASGAVHTRPLAVCVAVESFFDDISHAYQVHIEAAGKETHFLILVSFTLTFGFIRTSAHLIRAQVKWWPGNVQTKSGTHIHHLVWGILLLLTTGYLGLAVDMGSPWLELTAICFGIGMGLALDEFALWLNLEDVYWTSKGRQSIDAVFITASLLVISLLGLWFWIDVYEAFLLLLGVGGEEFTGAESARYLVPWQLLGIALGTFCLIRGRRLVGLVGLFIPLVAVIGAVRLATGRPESREPSVTK